MLIRMKIVGFILVILMAVVFIAQAEASDIREAILFPDGEKSISFSLRADIMQLPQFDEIRSEKLNRLIRHFSLQGSVHPAEATAELSLDSKPLFSISYLFGNETNELILTQKGRHYAFQESSDQPFFHTDISDFDDLYSNRKIYLALDEYAGLIQQLPEVFSDKTVISAMNYKYPHYGTAVKKETVTLDGKELNDYIEDHPDLLAGKSFLTLLNGIVFEGRQSFVLQFTEDHRIIRIIYKGKAGRSMQDLRQVQLDWKTTRSDRFDKDELTLKTPNDKSTKRNNMILSHVREEKDDQKEKMVWNLEKDIVEEGIRTRIFSKAEIEAEDHHLAGKMTQETIVRNDRKSKETIIDASRISPGSYQGTLEIISKKDKIMEGNYLLHFDLSAKGDIPKVDENQDEAIQRLNPEEFQLLREQVFSGILQEILSLPEEDLVFLKEGIPDLLWDTLGKPRN